MEWSQIDISIDTPGVDKYVAIGDGCIKISNGACKSIKDFDDYNYVIFVRSKIGRTIYVGLQFEIEPKHASKPLLKIKDEEYGAVVSAKDLLDVLFPSESNRNELTKHNIKITETKPIILTIYHLYEKKYAVNDGKETKIRSKHIGKIYDKEWEVLTSFNETKPSGKKCPVYLLKNINSNETIKINCAAMIRLAKGGTTISNIKLAHEIGTASYLGKKGAEKKKMIKLLDSSSKISLKRDFPKLYELFVKYNVLVYGTRRIYAQSLNERAFDLENTTPFELLLNNYISFQEGSWSCLIQKMVSYLQANFPLPLTDLYSYRTKWSDAQIFGPTKFMGNSKMVTDDLYVSINFTALHAVWIIQDLLKLYKIDLSTCYLLIHKAPHSEPKEIREAIENTVKKSFEKYLIDQKGKETETARKIVHNFIYLNQGLRKISKSYIDFFLIDSPLTLSNYKSILINEHFKYVNWTDKQVRIAKHCLDYYTMFFTEVVKAMPKTQQVVSISSAGKLNFL